MTNNPLGSLVELLRKANASLIGGMVIPEVDKQHIVQQLLSSVSSRSEVERFHKSVNPSGNARVLYPWFFIPPYNGGKKLRLITGELPKTHILSANHYELEILRILALWDGDNPEVRHMLDETLKRLDTACFTCGCPKGECVGTGVAALRFLSALRLRDDAWVAALLTHLSAHYNRLPVFYLYAAMPDIGDEACRKLVEEHKDTILPVLNRGNLTGPAEQDTYNITRLYVLRNALAMLPEYDYMRGREVIVSENDGRCRCETGRLLA